MPEGSTLSTARAPCPTVGPFGLTLEKQARARADWAYEPWVSGFLQESPTPMDALTRADPNRRVSPLGSRLLHLATMSIDRPDPRATQEVVRYLLVERGADPNLADDYGRTPLTMLVTRGRTLWTSHDALGCWLLDLLFAHGADANVLFAPDVVSIAECSRWTLAHHFADAYHGRPPLPAGMWARLDARLDRTVLDSEGRLAGPPTASPV